MPEYNAVLATKSKLSSLHKEAEQVRRAQEAKARQGATTQTRRRFFSTRLLVAKS
ncbi:MAG TPA: hypothetical protein VH186_00965 [Chloroflexia bacterium]|nr:hypothetical protein [Chloroflexia bacterium]